MPQMNDRKINPLSQDFTIRSLLRFALPSVVTMLFMGLYTIGDTILAARFVDTNALSAINIVTPVINLIVGLGTMLAAGGSAVIARKMGAGKEKEASQDFTLIVLSGVVLGIMIVILGRVFLDEIIKGLSASEQLFGYCREYLGILLIFTPASMLQVLFQNLIITAGRPRVGMVLSIGAGAMNVLLDYIFMASLEMGISGSALGTGIGYCIPAVIGICFFLRGNFRIGNSQQGSFPLGHSKEEMGNMRFERPVFRPAVLMESCTNGCSELVSQVAASVTTFLFNAVMIRLLGENGVAAITIIIYTQFLLTSLYIGFSMGVAPIISYRYGSQNYPGLKTVFHICLRFIGIVSILIFVLSMAAGSWLVTIFSPEGTEVYEIAREGFLIFPFGFLFCGWNIFSSSAFTALSNGTLSAVISFLRTFCFLTLFLILLPEVIGVTGVWLAVPIAEYVTMLMAISLLVSNRKKYHYL